MKRSMADYKDIINLPHHESKKHPKMSLYDRSAQFAPYAALVGYDQEIKETARLTDERIELCDTSEDELSLKLQIVAMHLLEQIPITFEYFINDERKKGGKYQTVTKIVRKIDSIERKVIFIDNESLSIDNIIDIQSQLFNFLDYNY